MKAVICRRYGSPDVLQIAEAGKPTPKEGEVLVKVCAASVNAYDWHLMRAKPFYTRFLSGLLKPKNAILGADIAGVVELCGKGADAWKPDDRVYGCLESCGRGGLAAGGFAEYVCVKASQIAAIPNGVMFHEAAALPMAAVTALQGLRDVGRLKAGQSVLVNGASGGVGTFAVQIAKALGADVTGVCGPGAAETVRALGADRVIDYTKEDFIRDGERYDLILDIAANRSVKDYRKALRTGGLCVVVGYSTFPHMLSIAFAGKRGGKTVALLMADNTRQSDLVYLNGLMEAGKLRAVIDSRYPLDRAADAMRHAETGHPKGKIVIEMTDH